MRHFLIATALLLGTAGVASARDFDPNMDPNTSLTPVPVHTTSTTWRTPQSRVKKDPTVPAKYDSAFPVRDRVPARHERDSI